MDNNALKAVMTEWQGIVEKRLEELSRPGKASIHAPIYDTVRYSLLNAGKRIRPILTLEFCRAAGGDPMIAAAMLPCICGAMHGVTPPYCACVYTGMGIAQSELKPTLANCMIWVVLHYVLSVVVMLGLLPIIGLG